MRSSKIFMHSTACVYLSIPYVYDTRYYTRIVHTRIRTNFKQVRISYTQVSYAHAKMLIVRLDHFSHEIKNTQIRNVYMYEGKNLYIFFCMLIGNT